MRLIDADAVKSSVKTQTEFVRLFGGELSRIADLMEQGFLQEVDNAPTIDAVPVVRCRKCMFWGNRWTGCPKLHGLETPDDFFCKYGKRREDGKV